MVLGMILCCLAAMMPTLTLYFQNLAEIPFTQMLLFAVIAGLLASIALGVMYLITRRKALSAVAATLWLLVLMNVGRGVPFLHRFFPLVGIKVIAPVVLVILVAATFGLSRLKEEFLKDAVKVLTIGLAFMILSSAVMALVTPKKAEQDEGVDSAETAVMEEAGSETPAREFDLSRAEGTDRPNIYWVIFDEYAGSKELVKYYSYEDPLEDNLRKLNYTVSEDSYNWNTSTYKILQNILNLEYGGSRELEVMQADVANPDRPLWQLLRGLGYEIYEMESSNKFELPNLLEKAKKQGVARTADGQTMLNLLLQYSILYRYEHEIADRLQPEESTKTRRDIVLQTIDAAEHFDQYKPESPACTVIYFNVPHAPYLFDRSGREPDKEQQNNWKDKHYYLDQLIYVSEHIETICRTLAENDPDSIIIVQSDHGQRLVANVKSLDCSNILNAVYFRGEAFDEIQGRNGMNTWIAVLNRQFNLGIDYVEEVRLKDEYREAQRDPELEDPNLN